VNDEVDVAPETVARRTWRERLQTPEGRVVFGVGVVVVVMTVLLLIFSVWWPLVSLPTSASDTMDAVRTTLLVFAVAAAPVMALVWAIAWVSIRRWGHGGDEPPEPGPSIRNNNRVVISWLVVSSVLTAFLLVWGLVALDKTTSIPTGANPLVVNVTGQQWLWSFDYPQDGGISDADLVLPVDRPVVFKVTSTDVIHSFWLPEMGIKVDANPAVTTEVSTTPNRLGTFNVRCAELCGLNHSYMQTTVTVLSKTDYDAWIRSHGGIPGQHVSARGSNG
jgi:cytochrome c oxidase subunit II